jgi:short subunit dehydrogenase-like uncharacterized protein
MTDGSYDIVVFGATGFVGQILCRYLFERHGVAADLRWAAAARSETKLIELRDELGPRASGLSLIVADAENEAGLRAMCAQTRVVISTVGPYALYGELLVKVCAESGTDYCDLTGEVQWMRQMIDRYEAAAQASGARIVHCCGFDSIPSDIGVYFLQQQAVELFGQPCSQIKMRVKAMRGGVSGGTVASMLNVVKEAARNSSLRKELANPYSLCDDDSIGTDQPNVTMPTWDADFDAWGAPFVMAAVNTRVVHRSNSLQDHPYGKDFRYDEATLTRSGIRGWMSATWITVGLGAFMIGVSLPPTRWLLKRWVLPKPGNGPSPEAQRDGLYDLHFFGTAVDGQSLRVRVAGDRDPGYGSTARMLGEAAMCLASEATTDLGGGFWTPATAFDDRFLHRLQTHAGLTFEVIDPGASVPNR